MTLRHKYNKQIKHIPLHINLFTNLYLHRWNKYLTYYRRNVSSSTKEKENCFFLFMNKIFLFLFRRPTIFFIKFIIYVFSTILYRKVADVYASLLKIVTLWIFSTACMCFLTGLNLFCLSILYTFLRQTKNTCYAMYLIYIVFYFFAIKWSIAKFTY